MDVQAATDYTVSLVEESYRIVNEATERLPRLRGQEEEHPGTYTEQCKDQVIGSVHFQQVTDEQGYMPRATSNQYSPRNLPKSGLD